MRVLVTSLLATGLLLAGCAMLAPPVDPRPVKELVAAAEDLVARKAYYDASELYAKAIVKEPKSGSYYLRRGELLEAIGQVDKAHTVYRTGLRRVEETAPERLQLAQSLALLSATDLRDLDQAEDLLPILPVGSAQHLDLSAFLYLQTGQTDEALKLLNLALTRTDDANQKAIILYHAALIYDQYQDEKNTFTSLYHAINHATHLGLIRKIEALWMKISGSEPLPRATGKPR
jgi:tetratricopeptide (TPR) repeat protein